MISYNYNELINKFNKSSVIHKYSFKIENNTYVYINPDNTQALNNDLILNILFYKSVIGKLSQGKIILNSDGYKTFTTKDRLNKILDDNKTGYRIYQENYKWYIYNWNYQERIKYAYADNVTFSLLSNKSYAILNYGIDNVMQLNSLKHKISKYVNNYYKQFTLGKINKPDNSDCIACLFQITDDNDHLLSHIDENYLVPSLLVNACIKYSDNLSFMSKHIIGQWYENNNIEWELINIVGYQIRKVLYKYLINYLITDS